MKKKLYTGYNEYEDIARSMEFEVVSEVPEVGDAWGSTCEVTGVTEVSLDNNENDKSYLAIRHTGLNILTAGMKIPQSRL